MKRLALALLLVAPLIASAEPDLADATALYAAGRYDEAQRAFDTLATARPADAAILYHLGKLAVRRRDYPHALDLLGRAAQAAPQDANITLWLGNAHAWSASVAEGFSSRISHGRKALAAYRRAVELDPENVAARFSLMNFYRHVPAMLGGGIDRAFEQANEIARRDPVAGAHARALLSFHQRHYAVAFRALQLLLEKTPQHYGANFLLGRLALASGQYTEEARLALQRCLQLVPTENDESHEEAQAMLAQLQGGVVNMAAHNR